MNDVLERLLVAMNSHDLEGAAGLFHPDYRSEQPAHPERAFVGRDQLRANWTAMFAGIPNFKAELLSSVDDGDTTWTEWLWSGIRDDGLPFEARGVALFQIADGKIAAGRIYIEDVERETGGIDEAVHTRSGHRPRQ